MLSRSAIRIGLIPVDLILKVVGPRYAPFFWFLAVAPPALIAWLGRLRAVRATERAAQRVPAYRDFLHSNQVGAVDMNRLVLPATDKGNYINVYSPEQRCVDGRLTLIDTAVDESSGSTGTPYNWFRSLNERHASHIFISHFARYCYGKDPWITINAFSMGAWATGINMGIALQRNSLVKNTGPDLDKIFSTLQFFGPGYRYLVCGYPPFLKHMIDVARDRHFPLKEYQLMALLGGEGNSEGLRDYLSNYFQPVFSGYGATDIEIGVAGETPISLAIRRECRNNAPLREAVFGRDSRLPMVFQYNPLMHHIVTNDAGELIFTVTRLNLLAPRIAYNIHDEGGVSTYSDMATKFGNAGVEIGGLEQSTGAKTFRLPFLWVYGRKDSTISIMGCNIYPEDIEQCLYDDPVLAGVSNSFCLSLREGEEGAVRPCFSFEILTDVTDDLQHRFESHMTASLRSLNADFREAMQEHAGAVTPLIDLFPVGTGLVGEKMQGR